MIKATLPVRSNKASREKFFCVSLVILKTVEEKDLLFRIDGRVDNLITEGNGVVLELTETRGVLLNMGRSNCRNRIVMTESDLFDEVGGCNAFVMQSVKSLDHDDV